MEEGAGSHARGRRGDGTGTGHRRADAWSRIGRHAPAGARNCPMFPADNVWNTHIANLPVDPTARSGWPAWTPPLPTSTRTSDRQEIPRIPTASPTPWCPRHNPWCRSRSSTPTRAIPGPTRSVPTRRLRAVSSPRATATPSWSTRPRAPSTSSRRAVQLVGFDRGLRGDLEPGLQHPAPGRMDVGRCGRPPDPAGPRALRRGAVGRHHPCHPDDGGGDGHVVHLAGPPRGGDSVQPGPPAHGCPVPAQGQLRHIGLLGPGPGGAAAPCSSTG